MVWSNRRPLEPIRTNPAGNFFFDAGIQPAYAEIAADQMRLFLFRQIQESHHKVMKTLDGDVHSGGSQAAEVPKQTVENPCGPVGVKPDCMENF